MLRLTLSKQKNIVTKTIMRKEKDLSYVKLVRIKKILKWVDLVLMKHYIIKSRAVFKTFHYNNCSQTDFAHIFLRYIQLRKHIVFC